MIFIIAHHFSVHGGIVFSTPSFNSVFVQILSLGGKIGVNLFVLITGYFGVTKKFFSINKISKFIIKVSFYSVMLYLICCALGFSQFGIRFFADAVFPMIFRSSDYWFFSIYLLLYLSTPFLNAAISKISERLFLGTIAVSLLFFIIVPQFISAIGDVTSHGFSELIWFYTMYLVGAYIRLYNPLKSGFFKIIVALSLSSILFCAINCVYELWGATFSFGGGTFGEISNSFLWSFKKAQMNNLFPFVISLLWFLLFQKIKMGNLKFLNLIGGSTFGIYLIHDNDYLRPILWGKIFKLPDMSESRMFFIYAIFCIAIVLSFSLICSKLLLFLLVVLLLIYVFLSFLIKPFIHVNFGIALLIK